MRNKIINSCKLLKINNNENIKNTIDILFDDKIRDNNFIFNKICDKDFGNRNGNSIRLKYKKIKNESKSQTLRDIKKTNTIMSTQNQIIQVNQIKVIKNRELFTKKIIDNNLNKYLNTENGIEKKYLKYREFKSKEKNDNKINIEESITRNSASKFIFYKRLKFQKLLQNNKDEVKIETDNNYIIKKDKNITPKYNIINNNLKNIRRINNNNYFNGFNSLNNIKLYKKNKINKYLEKEKRKEEEKNIITKEKIDEDKLIKNENIIKINLLNKYKKRIIDKEQLNNKEKDLNRIYKNDKYILRKNHFLKNKAPNLKEIINISNIENNKTTIDINNNKDNYIENKEEKKFEIIGKEISSNQKLFNQIKIELERIISKTYLSFFNLDDFKRIKSIGEGTYGTIYEFLNKKTNKKYAIKIIIAHSLEKLEKFLKELEICHFNPHENILTINGIFIKYLDNKYVLHILMDLSESDWDTAIKERAKDNNYYSETELIIILKQITSALAYLQKERNIAHRDIKPENILIFKNNIYKLCDFGEAKISQNLKRENSLRGTEIYMSPALYNGLKNNFKKVQHNIYKSDVFSLGYCLIYAASLNFNIIYTIRELKFQGLVEKMLFKFMKSRYSKDFIQTISKMITINEDERIDFVDLEEILNRKYKNISIKE